MKTKITTIAAAIAVALSMGVSAEPRDPNYDHDGNTFNGGKGAFDNQAGIRNGLNNYTTTANPGTRDSIILQNGGDGNVANATQKGTEQYSRIRQIDSGMGNQAFVNQGLNSGGNERNESEVLQVGGTDNLARVTQTGDRNDSFIRQTGTGNNTADVEQLNNTDLSDSIIFQDGDGNEAYVSQRDNTQTTWSHIAQTGDDNYADVTQVRADNSASYIFQDGAAHTATVVQRDERDSLSMIRQNNNMGGAAVATHTQINGANNYASSLQW